MSFLDLAKARYSVRSFCDKPVEEAKVQKLLEAAQLAPTACNKQPVKILVLKSPSSLETLKKCTRSHFGTTLAMIFCYRKDECWVREYDGKASGDVDASIVTTHVMLEAAELGLGSTWVMHFDPAALRYEFRIPEELEPVSLLVMGYPSEEAAPSPRHAQTKSLEELTELF